MCGIAGIIDHGAGFGADEIRRIAIAMRDTMVHRGPDDAGVWVDDDGRCALAHRRLAIIDLRPEGRQPMGNEDGSVQVTFNGEIYNYQVLRRALQGDGHRFRTDTDSEVLPHLFEPMEAADVDRLDGMYGFAAWRRRDRRLLLARDPFGKKPLYYAAGPGWFAFASELHALAQVPGLDDTIDRDALGLYLLLQYVPDPRTIWRGAQKLPPGSTLEMAFDGDAPAPPRITRRFEFKAEEPRDDRLNEGERREALHAAVVEAVRKRLIGDVPLGAFLSGGVDSSLVVAVMARTLGLDVRTFSIGFADTDETEHEAARQVAAHLGTEHRDQILDFDAVRLVGDIAERLDEPNGDSSCLPTFLLSRFTRQHVTVALSGDGGDELFGGYGRYRDTLNEAADVGGRLRRSVRARRWWTPADGYLSPRLLIFEPSGIAPLMGGSVPDGVTETLEGWRQRLNDRSQPVLHRLRTLDAATYMPGAVLAKVDRMSMQFALEVRCPLLDRDVARLAAGLPAACCWTPPAETKRILKELADHYLPPAWMRRSKMGFGLPARAWSPAAFLDLARDTITAPGSRLGDLLDPAGLRAFLDHQAQPGCFSVYQLWPMLVLELWLRRSFPTPDAGSRAGDTVPAATGAARR